MDVEDTYQILDDIELPRVVTRYADYQAPRSLRTESEVAEKEGAQRIVTALPAPDLSMKALMT
jgi:hypothetical protein